MAFFQPLSKQLWINMAPVTYKAAEYFGVVIADINWFSLVFLFVSIPFCFISTLSVNRLGLRAAVSIVECIVRELILFFTALCHASRPLQQDRFPEVLIFHLLSRRRAQIHIGGLLNCLGAVVRAVATSGVFAAEAEYPVCLAGQVSRVGREEKAQ